jgi:hypothetical protein
MKSVVQGVCNCWFLVCSLGPRRFGNAKRSTQDVISLSAQLSRSWLAAEPCSASVRSIFILMLLRWDVDLSRSVRGSTSKILAAISVQRPLPMKMLEMTPMSHIPRNTPVPTAYLLAIKRQALLDAKANTQDHRTSTMNEKNESKSLSRMVVLHNNTGAVLFSYRLQTLVRTLLQHRHCKSLVTQ